MDIEIEKEIVNRFIQKNARQRVIFELSSPKRRNQIGTLDTKFDYSCINDVSKSVNSYKVIWKLFESYGAKSEDDCYLLGLTESKIMPLEQALKENVFKGIFLIYWIKGKIAFWEGERYSAPPRYILKKDTKQI